MTTTRNKWVVRLDSEVHETLSFPSMPAHYAIMALQQIVSCQGIHNQGLILARISVLCSQTQFPDRLKQNSAGITFLLRTFSQLAKNEVLSASFPEHFPTKKPTWNNTKNTPTVPSPISQPPLNKCSLFSVNINRFVPVIYH